MKSSRNFREAAWESLVIASIVAAAFLVFFDPRLRGSDLPVPGWLADQAVSYSAAVGIFWALTALVRGVNHILSQRGPEDSASPAERSPSR